MHRKYNAMGQWGEKGRDQETAVSSGVLSHVEDLGHCRLLLSEHSALDGSPYREVSQSALVVKNPPANAGDLRDAGSVSGWEDPLEKGVAIHSSILAWEFHGQRILAGYNLWARKESVMTE